MTRAVYRCGQETHCSRCGTVLDDEWIFKRWVVVDNRNNNIKGLRR